MANNWFKFKQFTVEQDTVAMKVGTDGVLLGAWAALENAVDLLDVGTGTGLLALMAAQRSAAKINAIDIEGNAIETASRNFKNSPWHGRFLLHHVALQDYAEIPMHYPDFIICNPPFFSDSLLPPETGRRMARHDLHLPLPTLFEAANNLLSPNGQMACILPADNESEVLRLTNKFGFFLHRLCRVRPNSLKPHHRILFEVGRVNKRCLITELTIATETRHEYTDEYKELTSAFYLNF